MDESLRNQKKGRKSLLTVLRKPLTVALSGAVLFGSAGLFAACGDSSDSGDGGNGNQPAIYSGTSYAGVTAKEGDFFNDTDDHVLYKYANGAWQMVINGVENQPTIYSGTSYDNVTAKEGDFFNDTDNHVLYKYTNGEWQPVMEGEYGVKVTQETTEYQYNKEKHSVEKITTIKYSNGSEKTTIEPVDLSNLRLEGEYDQVLLVEDGKLVEDYYDLNMYVSYYSLRDGSNEYFYLPITPDMVDVSNFKQAGQPFTAYVSCNGIKSSINILPLTEEQLINLPADQKEANIYNDTSSSIASLMVTENGIEEIDPGYHCEVRVTKEIDGDNKTFVIDRSITKAMLTGFADITEDDYNKELIFPIDASKMFGVTQDLHVVVFDHIDKYANFDVFYDERPLNGRIIDVMDEAPTTLQVSVDCGITMDNGDSCFVGRREFDVPVSKLLNEDYDPEDTDTDFSLPADFFTKINNTEHRSDYKQFKLKLGDQVQDIYFYLREKGNYVNYIRLVENGSGFDDDFKVDLGSSANDVMNYLVEKTRNAYLSISHDNDYVGARYTLVPMTDSRVSFDISRVDGSHLGRYAIYIKYCGEDGAGGQYEYLSVELSEEQEAALEVAENKTGTYEPDAEKMYVFEGGEVTLSGLETYKIGNLDVAVVTLVNFSGREDKQICSYEQVSETRVKVWLSDSDVYFFDVTPGEGDAAGTVAAVEISGDDTVTYLGEVYGTNFKIVLSADGKLASIYLTEDNVDLLYGTYEVENKKIYIGDYAVYILVDGEDGTHTVEYKQLI